MSSTTKIYEEKMNNCVSHLTRELGAIRAGRANPAVLDKTTTARPPRSTRWRPWPWPRPAS